MNTSRKNPFLSEVLDGDKIPLGTLSYFRERFRDRLYDLVMEEFLKKNKEKGLTRAEVARRIGRRPEQITRWFGAPGNWTLETVSDLLLAVAKSEPDVRLLPLEGRAVRSYRSRDLPTRRSNEPARIRPSRTAIEANRKPAASSAVRASGTWNPISVVNHALQEPAPQKILLDSAATIHRLGARFETMKQEPGIMGWNPVTRARPRAQNRSAAHSAAHLSCNEPGSWRSA